MSYNTGNSVNNAMSSISPLKIIMVIIVIALVYFILKYIFSTSNTLQDNLSNGQSMSQIEASSMPDSGTSTNFGYSIWFYVNDWTYRYGKPKIIFARMNTPDAPGTAPAVDPLSGSSSNSTDTVDGISSKQPSPCVVLGAIENDLTVLVSCFAEGSESKVFPCTVQNIPIQKWVNLSVSVFDRTLDIYLDGKLVKTCVMPGTVSVKPTTVYVTPNGGFDGWTSKFSYFPTAMNPQDAWNIYAKGPTGWLSNLSTYQIQLSLIENGTPQSSVTI
jgi:hypothetical protein